ncbi:MAG: lysophospholipid acyltransferase family protein [Bacillota bacterium]
MDWFYWFSHKVLKTTFKVFLRSKVRGVENIPQTGPLIVVANHVSNFDPPVLGAALNREIHYMAKSELFENFFLEKIMRTYGAFPVKRGRPDTKAIKEALRLIDEDEVLGIFPEGTRSKTGKLGRAKLGSVLLATKSKAPLLPVGLKTRQPFKKGVEVNIGQSFSLDDYYERKLDRQEMRDAGAIIMNQIAELLD